MALGSTAGYYAGQLAGNAIFPGLGGIIGGAFGGTGGGWLDNLIQGSPEQGGTDRLGVANLQKQFAEYNKTRTEEKASAVDKNQAERVSSRLNDFGSSGTEAYNKFSKQAGTQAANMSAAQGSLAQSQAQNAAQAAGMGRANAALMSGNAGINGILQNYGNTWQNQFGNVAGQAKNYQDMLRNEGTDLRKDFSDASNNFGKSATGYGDTANQLAQEAQGYNVGKTSENEAFINNVVTPGIESLRGTGVKTNLQNLGKQAYKGAKGKINEFTGRGEKTV